MEEKILELKKCCGRYPEIRVREDGARRIVCPVCGKSTLYYLTAGINANIAWNEIEDEDN